MRDERDNIESDGANLLDKVSNGRLLSKAVDFRTRGGRRFKHLVQSFAEEIGGDLTETELGLIKQAVALQMQAERMQEDIVNGKPIDPDQLIRVSGTSKRMLAAIAGKAKEQEAARDPFAEHLARRRAAAAAEAAAAINDPSEYEI